MKGIILLLCIVALYVSFTEASCSSRRKIRRVYVVRRSLRIKAFSVPKVCLLAHSGLILEMTDGKQCVLEYMADGQSHLYDARPSRTTNCWFGRSCKKLVMKDGNGLKYTWTRQKIGTAFPSGLSVTPQAAQRKMQSIMGSTYQLLSNNCHLAQERLRRSWGLSVRQSYSNVRTVCTCVKWIRPFLSNRGFSGLIKNFCKPRRG